MEAHLPIFQGRCSNFELMRILLILWIAVMVQWQYFIIYFFIQGTKFLYPSMKAVVGTCPCPHSLDHLDFRLFICGSHNQNQDEFTVRFISRWKFIFLFLRKLFKFWAYANSLDHLDCSHGALAVFLFQEANFSPINEGICWNLRLC